MSSRDHEEEFSATSTTIGRKRTKIRFTMTHRTLANVWKEYEAYTSKIAQSIEESIVKLSPLGGGSIFHQQSQQQRSLLAIPSFNEYIISHQSTCNKARSSSVSINEEDDCHQQRHDESSSIEEENANEIYNSSCYEVDQMDVSGRISEEDRSFFDSMMENCNGEIVEENDFTNATVSSSLSSSQLNQESEFSEDDSHSVLPMSSSCLFCSSHVIFCPCAGDMPTAWGGDTSSIEMTNASIHLLALGRSSNTNIIPTDTFAHSSALMRSSGDVFVHNPEMLTDVTNASILMAMDFCHPQLQLPSSIEISSSSADNDDSNCAISSNDEVRSWTFVASSHCGGPVDSDFGEDDCETKTMFHEGQTFIWHDDGNVN